MHLLFSRSLNVLQNNYANFNGRARRSEYWFFTLFNTIAMIALVILAAIIGNFGFILVLIYLLGIIVPLFALITRRLHDIGKSGWFYSCDWRYLDIGTFLHRQ
ncbi:MAG: DUF805 domain-containing protein [Arcicella sp.]|nr:DUF805 domain-containing protein [Arcicella sp.]